MTALNIQQAIEHALAHHNAGQLQDAERSYREILVHEPNNPLVLHLLGTLALQVGNNEAGAEFFRQSLSVRPDHPDTHSVLGLALSELNRVEEAIAHGKRAIELLPTSAENYNRLGLILKRLGRYAESVEAHKRAVELAPQWFTGHHNLYVAQFWARQIPQAIESCRRALSLRSDAADHHFDLAVLLLMNGEMTEGWREWEHRWNSQRFRRGAELPPGPAWDGSDGAGRTILLLSEQGIGDTFHFIRYAPLIVRRGWRVIVSANASIADLVRSVEGVAEVVEIKNEYPPFDAWRSLMSLPLLFDTTLENIPINVPYITPDPQRVEQWKQRLSSDASKLRVGLNWAGSPRHDEDRFRSTTLANLAPLADVPNVTFYSLQKGEAAAQASNPPTGMKLIDWTADLHDFSDTAALVDQLDLVITVDTSVTHLAGALGKKTWNLLSFNADWRWMLEREDSPWYPTMRLFRQARLGDWTTVAQRVASELKELAK